MNNWMLSTCMGDPDQVLDAWHWPGATPAIVGNRRSELASGRSLFVSVLAFQINKKITESFVACRLSLANQSCPLLSL